MREDASSIRQQHALKVLATLSNAIIGLLARRGFSSLKQATETFCAQPALALDLIASTV